MAIKEEIVIYKLQRYFFIVKYFNNNPGSLNNTEILVHQIEKIKCINPRTIYVKIDPL